MAAATFSFQFANEAPQTLELDAVTQHGHQLDADITQYPIELGADPSDHIQPKAEMLSLGATVAEWRLGDPAPAPGAKPSRIPTAMALLVRIRDTGTLVTFKGLGRSLDGCGLSKLTFDFDAKSSNTLRFSCALTHIHQVQTRAVPIVRTSSPKGAPTVDEGVKPTTDAEVDQSEAFRMEHANDAKLTGRLVVRTAAGGG